MKRIGLLVCVLAMLWAFSGCSHDSGSGSSNDGGSGGDTTVLPTGILDSYDFIGTVQEFVDWLGREDGSYYGDLKLESGGYNIKIVDGSETSFKAANEAIGNSEWGDQSSFYIDLSETHICIDNDGFSGNNHIYGIVLPNTCTEIENEAFSGCRDLYYIYMTNTQVTKIGYRAFSGCYSLGNGEGEVVFSSCLQEIGEEAFWNCSRGALPDLDFSYTSLKIIREKAFYGCTSLWTVKMPSSLCVIEKGVFSGCSVLSEIEIPVPEDGVAWGSTSTKAEVTVDNYDDLSGSIGVYICEEFFDDTTSTLINGGNYYWYKVKEPKFSYNTSS